MISRLTQGSKSSSVEMGNTQTGRGTSGKNRLQSIANLARRKTASLLQKVGNGENKIEVADPGSGRTVQTFNIHWFFLDFSDKETESSFRKYSNREHAESFSIRGGLVMSLVMMLTWGIVLFILDIEKENGGDQIYVVEPWEAVFVLSGLAGVLLLVLICAKKWVVQYDRYQYVLTTYVVLTALVFLCALQKYLCGVHEESKMAMQCSWKAPYLVPYYYGNGMMAGIIVSWIFSMFGLRMRFVLVNSYW